MKKIVTIKQMYDGNELLEENKREIKIILDKVNKEMYNKHIK